MERGEKEIRNSDGEKPSPAFLIEENSIKSSYRKILHMQSEKCRKIATKW
jgi:hypothetical protein